jgi:hypothetical protein
MGDRVEAAREVLRERGCGTLHAARPDAFAAVDPPSNGREGGGIVIEFLLGIHPLTLVLPFVALVLAAIWAGPRACFNGGCPTDRIGTGEPCWYREEGSRAGFVVAVSLAFDVPRGFRFTLRREGLYDRFAKAIGIAREPQLSHESFNDGFYLDAEDGLAPRLLEGSARLPTLLDTGFARMTVHGARLHLHLRTFGPSD